MSFEIPDFMFVTTERLQGILVRAVGDATTATSELMRTPSWRWRRKQQLREQGRVAAERAAAAENELTERRIMRQAVSGIGRWRTTREP